MATQKQIEANRRNAQKSTGPRTHNGKLRARQNSRKDKAYECEPLLPGEKPDNLDALVGAYERQFNPQTPIESDLVFQLAATQYRMLRALRFESSIFDFHVKERIGQLARHGDSVDIDTLVTETVTVDASHGNALSKVSLYENRLARRYEHTRKQLEQIQSLSKQQTKISKTNPIEDLNDSTLIIVD